MKYLFSCQDHIEELRSKPLAFFLDYDGTLVPIASEPKHALMPASTKKLLRTLLSKKNYKVAVVSGRSLKDIKAHVGIRNITYAGNHGLEISGPGIAWKNIVPDDMLEALRSICSELKERLKKFSGIRMEDKIYSLSVHYRLSRPQDVPPLRQVIRKAAASFLRRKLVQIRNGKKVMEILPHVDWNKGEAVNYLWRFWKSQSGRSFFPIVCGDDLTDEDGFRVLEGRGLTIHVGKNSSHAEYYLKTPDELIQFLKGFIELK